MAYDRVILRDLGSRNGIRVNGRMVDEVRLQPGDEVAIGPILFRFEGQPAEKVAPPGASVRPSPGASLPPVPPPPARPPGQARRRPPARPAALDLDDGDSTWSPWTTL